MFWSSEISCVYDDGNEKKTGKLLGERVWKVGMFILERLHSFVFLSVAAVVVVSNCVVLLSLLEREEDKTWRYEHPFFSFDIFYFT